MSNALKALVVVIAASLTAGAALGQEPEPGFQNLKVLPADISPEELDAVMIDNLRGLGLPRRQSQGCLYCHVGDMDRPSNTWDWASDEKPEKRKARAMMAMVETINRDHLSKLKSRVKPAVRVTCHTCHSGRTDPRPLPAVLESAYEAEGIDGAIARYRELHGRYFAADAYDFRVGVLSGLAFQLADDGAYEDALALAELNGEVYPGNADARRTWLQIRLLRRYEAEGVQALVAEFDGFVRGEGADWPTLDGLGWGLYRKDRQEDALLLFRRNVQEFPGEYVPNESLADALWFLGEKERAIEMFEAWLLKHPGHEMGARRLATLRSRL